MAILSLFFSDLRVTMIWSSVLGMNLKEEKSCVGIIFFTRLTEMSSKFWAALSSRLVFLRSSFRSL